ncbi:MAG: hypothetical protein IPJ75_03930 [Ignavibacteriales bacterium]|nr:hypothetical protein [Ignavibacteriales bacterium]
MESGYHQVSFDAANLPSGLYLYEIKAGEFSSIKKMLFNEIGAAQVLCIKYQVLFSSILYNNSLNYLTRHVARCGGFFVYSLITC